MLDTAEPARAVPAHDRSHEEVFDRDTGAWLTVGQFLGKATYPQALAKRMEIEQELLDGQARYVCPWCVEAMVLRSTRTRERTEQRFYFKHREDTGQCSGTKGLSAAVICARRFALCKEGAMHKRLKALTVEALEDDASFSDIEQEARWWDADGVRWRQPDVQATHGGHQVAFEIQLSTTFVHVIAERMRFYRRNEGRLLWLFRDLDVGEFRLAEDDIFYANNRNAFRINAETVEKSKAAGRLVLECVWMRPTRNDTEIVDVVTRQHVFFDELTFDVGPAGTPRAFHFDYDAARAVLDEEVQALGKLAMDQAVRDELQRYVMASHREQGDRAWQILRGKLRARGVDAPVRYHGQEGPFYLLQAGYSAMLGRPVACKMTNLMSLANNLWARHKDTLWVFTVLLGHYGNGPSLAAHGDVAAWKAKRNKYRRGWLERDLAYKPDRRFDDLLSFAFPEVAELLRLSPSDPEAQRLARHGRRVDSAETIN